VSGNGPKIPCGISASLRGFASKEGASCARNSFAHRFKRKTPEEDNTEIYHGLADAFGLESLMPYDEKQVPPLIMRASICRHRHCMYFQVSLEEGMVKRIKALMKNRACDEAVKLIKERASIIHVPKEFLDSLQLIPDQRLDPWKNYLGRIE